MYTEDTGLPPKPNPVLFGFCFCFDGRKWNQGHARTKHILPPSYNPNPTTGCFYHIYLTIILYLLLLSHRSCHRSQDELLILNSFFHRHFSMFLQKSAAYKTLFFIPTCKYPWWCVHDWLLILPINKGFGIQKKKNLHTGVFEGVYKC